MSYRPDFRVIVPVAPTIPIHPRVLPAIYNEGYTAEVMPCVNEVGHPMSYPSLLRSLFLSGDDFLIIEHDNETRPGFILDIENCGERWCFFAYDLSIPYDEAIKRSGNSSAPLGNDFAPLGHTFFGGELGEKIKPTLDSDFFQASWVARDTLLSGALVAVGYSSHRHEGKCFHHHPYPNLG